MRSWKFVALKGAFTLALGVLAPDPGWAQRSVTYQITPSHTGAVEFPLGFELPLRKVWSRDFGGLENVSYPVAAGKRVFVTTGDNRQTTYGTNLYALDASTGQILWKKRIIGIYFWSALAYDRGRLFVINVDGLLRALDPESGSELWVTQLPFLTLFSAPPVARGGIVYLSGSRSGGALFAVNGIDGTIMWWKPVETANKSSPTLSSDGIFVSYPCGAYQFDAVTGEQRWKYVGPCNGFGELATAYYADRVYARDIDVGNAKPLRIYGGLDGTRIGTISEGLLTPAFRGGNGFFVGTEGLAARSVVSGRLLWTFNEAGRPALPPIVINGKVLVASSAGKLFVLDEKSGQILQRIPLGRPIPISDEGALRPLPGLGVNGGTVLVPAGTKLFAFKGARSH